MPQSGSSLFAKVPVYVYAVYEGLNSEIFFSCVFSLSVKIFYSCIYIELNALIFLHQAILLS